MKYLCLLHVPEEGWAPGRRTGVNMAAGGHKPGQRAAEVIIV